LKSDDPRRVAWGAWLVKVDRQTELIPLLVEKATGSSLNDEAMLCVLDALIELHATMPVDDARRLYPQFAAQSIILLVAYGGAAQQALLEIFDRTEDNAEWLAAGNVLFNSRTPGFVARVLDKFTQHLTVSVLDPGSVGGVSGGAQGCGSGFGSSKDGWPPIVKYHLTQFPARSAMFLVGGETPVYYTVYDPGCAQGDRDRYRAQYLVTLFRYVSSANSLDAYPDARVEWQDPATYPGQVAAAIGEQRKFFEVEVGMLQLFPGLLTPDEAALLKPHIEVVVHDWRSNKSIPLPTIPEVKTAFSRPLL
jgi:hypothetical protein